MTTQKWLTRFSRDLVICAVLVIVLAIVFALSVRSEAAVRDANALRHTSFRLAEELRRSSDELTRMVRTYAVTGDTSYRRRYQEILDIRSGRRPRPSDYGRAYWDWGLADIESPRPGTGRAIALLDLMRQAGFTEGELAVLGKALARSDSLAVVEREVIRLLESAGPGAGGARERARLRLYDQAYHRAKASIMAPIDEFYEMMDTRTRLAVSESERYAEVLRYVFVSISLLLVFMLWRSYGALREVLGGSLDEVYALIGRLGRGDFASEGPLDPALQDSVRGWLLATQATLSSNGRERDQSEEALRRSEVRFRSLVSATAQIVWTTDASGNVAGPLPAWQDYTGQSDAEIQGAGWAAALHPDDTARALQVWGRAVETTSLYEVEYRIRRRDGVYRHFLARGVPVLDGQGAIREWVGTCTDIHEAKVAAEALLESQEALRFTLDAAHIGYWSLDLVTHSAYRSPRHDRIFGYPDLLPEWTYARFLEHVHPEDRERVDQGFQAGVASKTSWSFECRIHRADGELRWIEVHGRVFVNPAGEATRMLGMVTDITVRQQAEEDIRRFNAILEQRVAERTAQLETANRELEAFSYSVSHDLRAPLRGIDSFCNLLLEDYGPRLDEEGRRQLNVVRGEAQRMGHLIDDLLNFSRLGRQEMVSTQIDMAQLARSVFEDLPEEARNRVARFDVGDLPPAFGDRSMLRQVFVNLISNAVKFSSREPEPRIVVSGEATPEGCTYQVKDNGVGFDARYTGKLFGVFQRLHSESEFEGTGVGLALVQRVIHRHGGKVWAEGKVNEGATFYFFLPRRPG